jgi:lipase chaperone LimK
MKHALALVALLSIGACTPGADTASQNDDLDAREASHAQKSVPPLPKSLAGTTPAGGFTLSGKTLLVDAALRARFDHYLSAEDEESLDIVRTRVERDTKSLPSSAAKRVLAVFDEYTAYRKASREAAAKSDGTDALTSGQARETLLRESVLSDDVAHGFFAEDDAVNAAFAEGLANRKSEEQVEASLPAAVQEARAQARLPLKVMEQESRLAGKPAEIAALRERSFGTDGRERLEALDRVRAERAERVAAFKAERARIQADSALQPSERENRTEEAFESIFPENERIRARVWTR